MSYKNLLKLSILILLFVFWGCEKKEEKKVETQEIKKIEVEVNKIVKKTYPIWVNFSGKTEAFKNVEVTSRVSGELKEIYFKAGDEVKKDQLLFKIDDSQYKAILEQKIAGLQKDEASLNLAISNVNRYKPLVKDGLAPREKLDELVATQKQLQAVVNASKASIKQATLDVEYTQIRATIDGKVGQNLLDVGNLVNATSTVLTKIVDSKKLYVNFNPSANEVSLIKKYKSQDNPTVKVKLENNDSIELKGNIDFIDNTTNQSTGTVLMRAIIENKDNIIFPGTFVEIKLFITDEIPVIAIHPNTLGQNQLGTFVYVVNTENKLETRQVEIQYSNEDIAIIKSGLNEGDNVVVSDITKLGNGMLVNATVVENKIKN
ncbi:MAG: efflux RND transporter periplasmic adaptor subunit [Arcobacter sp.]|jgi:RND family efflux transporter MFP subunit|uniref:efflux RND transporter periplasmic adaptor subunit n=1 Tax=Arcobacter sp. TaxID=1872629 RepID=UPI002A763EDE|nr:efflux RND transporter periplasmic adaptor subunit [Arcobacter sp.]MDY3204306.1 efflux RND transporter periplasmic adaptor subunit [Arcobacter sp.]